MISLPTVIPVPAQTHAFHSTLAPFPLVNPDSRFAFARSAFQIGIIGIDADPFNSPLSRFTEHDVPEIMLLALNHPERLFQLGNSFLEIIMED